MIYYSKTTKGFYDSEIHGTNIPPDCVEITKEYHRELLNGQSNGKQITSNSSGYPILVDPPPPTSQQIQEQKNGEARKYLASTDWYVIRFADTGIEIPADIKLKRQQARDSIVE